MADVVLVGATKGGVGKTTTAVTLAAAAGWNNTPATLVDLDPQCSTTSWAIGRDAMYRLAVDDTVAGWARGGRVLHGPTTTPPPPGLPRTTHPFAGAPGVSVVASTRALRTTELVDLALDDVPGVVVVDCPPDMDMPVVRSLAPLVRCVVVPIAPEPACMPAVAEVIGWCFDNDRPDLADTMLVVLNMVGRTAVHQVCEHVIRQTHGDRVWGPTIARTTAVPEAELRREVVKRTSAPGKLFNALWLEVAARIHATTRRAAA